MDGKKDFKRVRTAVVGCGAISDIYLTNMMEKYSTLEVAACCAKHLESAQRKGQKYGIRACTYEEILADESIEMVVILTPVPTHYELIRQALLAGKHVYTEKSLTDCLENAEELVKLADEKQLYLGAAPETFLGACFQTAGQAIKDGLIGEVTSFNIYANRDINVLASRSLFLRLPGGGIAFDYGVYYLTALVSLLGPVESVFALKNNRERIRTNIFPESPEYGKQYEYDNETQITAVIRMESSVAGTFGIDGESNQSDMGFFQIYGTKGVLRLGDANCFGEPVLFIPNDAGSGDEGRVLTPVSELVQNCRGIGPAEMAWAIRNGKKCRTAKEMPYHILDIVFQMMKSSETGRMERVSSTCEKPEMLTDPTDILRKEK